MKSHSHRLLLYLSLLLLPLLLRVAVSRPLLSDGVDAEIPENTSSYSSIWMKTKMVGLGSSEMVCEQMYGFLPCSETVGGQLFLILVYEFLLFHGESYVASGGERIFKILGPGVFGASAFQVIGSLPEALILLASGLWSNEETAEECVVTGIGLLAGSTILLLTLIWGTCLILASQPFRSDSNTKHNRLEKTLFSIWPAHGVLTDHGTSYTARIMLISVVPLAVIQVPGLLGISPAAERQFLLGVLVVSIFFLLSYFFYQFFQPWIQRRRLLYIKHEHLVIDVLKHVQNQTRGRLLTDNGSPNVPTIRRIFEEKDQDRDNVISFHELKEFLKEIKFRKLNSDEESTAAEMMADFDRDNDQKITIDEFVIGMTKWLDESKEAMTKRYHSVKSLKDMYQVLRPWIQKKREEREMMKHLIPDILEYFQNSIYGGLLNEDGTPDVPAIKRLFADIDLDKDNCISLDELKEVISSIKFGIIPYNPTMVASKIMEELDADGDELISEEEFVEGLFKWFETVHSIDHHKSEESEGEEYQLKEESSVHGSDEEAVLSPEVDSDEDLSDGGKILQEEKTWEQTDKLIEDKFIDKSPLAWAKAIALVLLGIVMLGLLAEPLIRSVRNFSSSANLPSFFVAFVFVPLATNARLAVSAVTEARKKKMYTNSLTLSEIYGTAFMNNVLGLVVLLSLIYFRNITWSFSTEIVMVLGVSTVMGCLASFTTVIPIWTGFLAYLLYPFSLLLVYLLGNFDWSY